MSRACVLFDVVTSQFKTNGIWEKGASVRTCGPVYLCLVRWLEDAPAPGYEAGCLVNGVLKLRAVAVLLLPVRVAVSGFPSI